MVCASSEFTGERIDDYEFTNYTGSVRTVIPRCFRPTSLGEIVMVVRDAEVEGRRVKAAGSRWSQEDIAVSRDWLIDISALNQFVPGLVDGGPGSVLTRSWQERLAGPRDRLVHVQAGITIGELNRQLWDMGLAMPTLGGAQGQTLAGAISTSTHGSDVDHPPLPDLVQAVHLVTTGGQEVWIESSSDPLTRSDAALRALGSVLPCPDTRISRDDDALRSAIVGLGRFGVIYACVLRVTPVFHLAEWTESLPWREVADALAVGVGRAPGAGSVFGDLPGLVSSEVPEHLGLSGDIADFRYLDITFNARNADSCWVRRRWLCGPGDERNLTSPPNPLCHGGVANALAALAGGALETYAVFVAATYPFYGIAKSVEIQGHATALNVLAANPGLKMGPALAAILNGIWASQVFDELSWLIKEVNQAAIGGQFNADGKRGPSWQVTSGVDASAFDESCFMGSAVEVIFGLDTRAYIDYIDAVLAESGRFLHAGYISVRFSRASAALLSMHHVNHHMAVAIEITSLRGLRDSEAWLELVERLGVEMGGRLHWGQRNTLRSWQVSTLYGADNLNRWRERLLDVAGASSTFSNDFTSQRGLEPLGIRRHVTGVRRHGGVITHLCNEAEAWSPVPVADVIAEVSAGILSYYVTAPDGRAEQTVRVRRFVTTPPDASPANNLELLPDAELTYGRPPADLVTRQVTSVIRTSGRWRTVEYLCNDADRWCVTDLEAVTQILAGTHQYFLEARDGTRTVLEARAFLTTQADLTESNNLESLPPC